MKNIKFAAIIYLNSLFEFMTGGNTDLIEDVHVAIENLNMESWIEKTSRLPPVLVVCKHRNELDY